MRLTFSKKASYVKSKNAEEFICIKRIGTPLTPHMPIAESAGAL